MKKPEENICFVMMPFSDEFDGYYEDIYKPAIEESNLYPIRADSLFRPSPIIRDIWEYINRSKILIADITGLNPNVMYELGLAHAIAKPVIIISDSIEKVPFDLKTLRILIYDNKKPKWSDILKEKITQSVKEILAEPEASILTTFLTIKPVDLSSDAVSTELIEIKQILLNRLDSPTSEKRTKLTEKEYLNARVEAKRLYYDEGWDIKDIKDHLMNEYGLSLVMADDLFHKAIIVNPNML